MSEAGDRKSPLNVCKWVVCDAKSRCLPDRFVGHGRPEYPARRSLCSLLIGCTVARRFDPLSSSAQPRRSRRRPAKRDSASDHWLLLLGSITFIILVMSMLGPWSGPTHRSDASMTMAQARASNAALPIRAGRRVSATAFHFGGGLAAREQAAECLATAALYEAGDDGRGQRAVIQVVSSRRTAT